MVPTKGICLIWSRGRLFSPLLSCRGQGVGKYCGTISGWHKRTAGRNLVVHRHGTTLRQSVQRYRCRLFFSLVFSHFVLNLPCGRDSDYFSNTMYRLKGILTENAWHVTRFTKAGSKEYWDNLAQHFGVRFNHSFIYTKFIS